MKEVNKTLQYHWGHLNDMEKGFRSKTFPVSPLTGSVAQADFSKR
jgi:hypothetical protein